MLEEDFVSRKFHFPFAKEALKKRKDEEEKKRKRVLLDTSVVDGRAMVASSDLSLFIKPSTTKSSKRNRLSAEKEFINVSLPSDASAYSDLSFLKGIAESLLLLANRKRLADIGPV